MIPEKLQPAPVSQQARLVPSTLLAGVVLLSYLGAAQAGGAVATATAPSAATSQPRVVPYQRGIRIDWARRQVEVDATVILREGLIELFACSPNSREHESIVRIEAKPLHLFQALGLIGISPGHPVLYDDETGRRAPATGDPVQIEVRYAIDGRPQTSPIEAWMRRSADGQPVGQLQWVFAGSVELEDDSIAADYEGTVVALVDFGSSLVALPALHSDRNTDLWLEPATDAIPAVGTPCTLAFRPGPVEISLDAAGRLYVGGRRLTLADAARRIRELAGQEDPPRLRVAIDPLCPKAEARTLRDLLEAFGPDLEIGAPGSRPADEPLLHESDALAGWLTWQLQGLLPVTPPAEPRPVRQEAPPSLE